MRSDTSLPELTYAERERLAELLSGLTPAPPERIAAVLAQVGPRNLAYFGVDLADVELRATDADITLGSGTRVELPAKDILLTVTGRRPLP